MWLLDAARTLPSDTVCHGYDIDFTNAPVKHWLPNNVSFHHWNIFDDVPHQAIEKYDIVHVRLLILAIDGEEKWRLVIRNLLKMLKPGGYLQWDELDVAGTKLKKPDPSMPTPGLDGLFEKSRAGGRFDWDLRKVIGEEGFEDPRQEKFGDPDGMVRAYNDLHMMIMEEFAAGLRRIGKQEAAEAFAKDVDLAFEESVEGAAICFPRLVVVARKPE